MNENAWEQIVERIAMIVEEERETLAMVNDTLAMISIEQSNRVTE